MSRIVILGPQRLKPTVGEAVRRRQIRGPISLITAGWQEREMEDQELRDELGLPCVNLRLYERWEEILREDREFFHAHRARQDLLRQVRHFYQRRLNHLMEQANEVFTMNASDELLEPERRDVIASLQALDAHYLRRVAEINEEFEWSWRPASRPAVARHRRQVAQQLLGGDAVMMAGGHIAVILLRLRLFELAPLLRRRMIFAWSAGAMALTERVVLFHDTPPQGRGYAEVFEHGLALIPNVVVLPNARRRLRLDDIHRVELMARRLAPARCIPLDEGEGFEWYEGEVDILPANGLRELTRDGQVQEVHP
ncbi:MAG: hypothetical protein AAFV53_11820 [Myxococcota bacterium]